MRKRFLGLVLAIVCMMGLCTPTLAASTPKRLTDEEVQNMISVTYNVDGTKINIRDGIEVEEPVTYLRLEDHSDKNIMDQNYKRNIKKVSTTESSYLAIREDSTFEVSLNGGNTANSSSGMLNADTFVLIYATAYLQNDEGVYEPEYSCRQCLTSRGYLDETMDATIIAVATGYPARCKLPVSISSLMGKEKTDVLYGFELDLLQMNQITAGMSIRPILP